ncbi:MAG: CoA-binding protein, partial [Deltaproteobacteria bacterium]|nr:CoA-binding protein [Deltaproteobacteria bacterium]
MTIPDLNDFFQPQGVALIGASTKVGSPNYQTLKNSLDMSLNGKVFPVNPMAEEILGLPVHRSVVGIPDRVDLVIMAVASGNALQVAKEIRERRLKRGDAGAVVIVTAGFKEMGTPEAASLQGE